MRRVHNGLLGVTAALAFAIGGVACDNTARGAKQDAVEAQQKADEKAAEAKAEAREEAAEAKAEGRDAARRGARGQQSRFRDRRRDRNHRREDRADGRFDVDASGINVDTFHETKTVVLKGSVPTAAQKSEAARIAAREAKGYRVDNQLVVKPKS